MTVNFFFRICKLYFFEIEKIRCKQLFISALQTEIIFSQWR